MKTDKTRIHFTDQYLLTPTNPISVNLIGAGGTGSRVLHLLMEMNHSLVELGHPGLQIRLWDDDIVTEANLGRQPFAASEVGLYKSVAIINRVNRAKGTNWKAETQKFERNLLGKLPQNANATIFISCVDNVQSRFNIAEMLKEMRNHRRVYHDTPKYWVDYGNSQHIGQVFLSTIVDTAQPDSKKYCTVPSLPMVTDEFCELLKESESTDQTPSCSLAEALEKQDLFINSALAPLGCSLLWNLFRNGMTPYRGFFLNLKDFRSQPVPV